MFNYVSHPKFQVYSNILGSIFGYFGSVFLHFLFISRVTLFFHDWQCGSLWYFGTSLCANSVPLGMLLM